MENLTELKKQRGYCKSRLTKFGAFLDQLDSSQITQAQKDQLAWKYEKAKDIINTFEKLQSSIEELSNDLAELDERDEFESRYFTVLDKAKQCLNLNSQVSLASESQVSTQHDEIPTNTYHVKLPQIELPRFSGDIADWVDFYETFNTLIHNDQGLSPTQKFLYLRSALSGEASDYISSLKATSANYTVALELLCDQYNNPKLLLKDLLKNVTNINPISTQNSQALRKVQIDLAKNVRSLKALKLTSKQLWETTIISLTVSKLDKKTLEQWEEQQCGTDIPELDTFLQFLKEKASILGSFEQNKTSTPQKSGKTHSFASTTIQCGYCKKSHFISSCDQFKGLSIQERYNQAKRLNLCTNCLRPGHVTKACRSSMCKTCNGKHNTLLHNPNANARQGSSPSNSVSTNNDQQPSEPSRETFTGHAAGHSPNVLLATALVTVCNSQNSLENCRVLLDSGSQSNFVTRDFCKHLGIPITKTNITVQGIDKKSSNLTNKCSLKLSSRTQNFSISVPCFVIDDIADLPKQPFDRSLVSIPGNLELADPNFNIPRSIDVLLGAGTFWSIVQDGRFQTKRNEPIIQNSKFGWIVTGPLHSISCHEVLPTNNSFFCFKTTLQDQLTKFWEVEEVNVSTFSPEEKACEAHFINNFHRDETGRCIVSIPFKDDPTLLGDSQSLALKQFHSLEKRLNNNPKLKKYYSDFMSEYETLGHMSKVQTVDQPNFFLPHHGVLKETSSTTKLRVVFNGSAPSNSGYSLNKLEMVGPNIQQDLCSILIRFRTYKFVASSDITKMYRQILISPTDRRFQYIYWRENPEDQLNIYQLNTITYGTASAAYLAVRTLKELANIYRETYPLAYNIINHDFYVDDLLTGANSTSELINKIEQTNTVLQKGCLPLRKWRTNNSELLRVLNKAHTDDNHHFDDSELSKTLGLLWSHGTDQLTYEISKTYTHDITKRVILSETAHIFDPLGLVAPVIIKAKVFIQKLWSLNVDWDDPIPTEFHQEWVKYRADLLDLNSLKIPRSVNPIAQFSIELHGFCDASMSAYGACVYIKVDTAEKVYVNLMCAKTRVAPLKTLTIPRLELCGALLLAQLYQKVQSSIKTQISNQYFWCDSTIALSWIKTAPSMLQTFPSNRVAQIQQLTDSEAWRHVPTKDNPADILSRGTTPNQLINSDMWWTGPPFLKLNSLYYPNVPITMSDNLPEMRKVSTSLATVQVQDENSAFSDLLFNRFSSYTKFIRITALILRFSGNCKNGPDKKTGSIQAEEMRNATNVLIKLCQSNSFSEVISILRGNSKRPLPNNIHLLNPFIDDNGIIRVGGRLHHVRSMNLDKRHPMLLPKGHTLTLLIIKHYHEKLFHAGTQATLASIRECFWPISAKNTTRNFIHKCIVCFKVKPKGSSPLMGSLPTSRVTPSPPFFNCGVDYAGPFQLKTKNAKKSSLTKAYVCLFICMSTKAIHIELASDLSMEEFIACFRRFTSRRGKPSCIYSDNGKNFVAANKELNTLSRQIQTQLSNELSIDGIDWKFIPVNAPHFGGLWEAGVKSVKYHLKRVVGNLILTYEQFITVLVQIEGILNSRPITPLSADPLDLQALTPSHFLIGRKLTSAPDPNLCDINPNRLSKYQLLQQVQQHFWRRWQREYISELQGRQKWKDNKYNLEVGKLVLIKDDNLPPLFWHLGRIVKIFPGADGVARVADVFTHKGTIRRCFSKLCPLPEEDCPKTND